MRPAQYVVVARELAKEGVQLRKDIEALAKRVAKWHAKFSSLYKAVSSSAPQGFTDAPSRVAHSDAANVLDVMSYRALRVSRILKELPTNPDFEAAVPDGRRDKIWTQLLLNLKRASRWKEQSPGKRLTRYLKMQRAR